MKTFLIVIVVVILAVAGWLFVFKTGQRQNGSSVITVVPEKTSTIVTSEKAPDFHLQDYSGKIVSLSDFTGKSIVINSWASWCPFCRQELSDFATAQKEFIDKTVIIAVDRAESLSVAKGYTDKQRTTNNLIFLLDPLDSFYQSIGGFSMPETIFVNKNGEIVVHKRGPMEIQEIREKINQIIY